MDEFWEILEYLGETLVFFGVIGEVFAEWKEESHRKRLGRVSSLVLPCTSEDFQDSRNIAIEVTGILRKAGMNAAGWRLDSCLNPGNASNVVVGISGKDGSGGSSPADDKIAALLIKALTPEIGTFPEVNKYPSPAFLCQHSASDLDPQHPNNRKPDATINIIIGKKVQPILTREMLEPPEEKK